MTPPPPPDVQAVLTRTESLADGVFGQLAVPGLIVLHTVEDDWLDNRRGVSCIPSGVYRLRRTIYHKHGYEAFEVAEVPQRTRILIHPANTEEDVEGCIGIGLRRGQLWIAKDEDTGEAHEKQAVVASQEAFRRFMERMAGIDEATLIVRWAPGLPPEPRALA